MILLVHGGLRGEIDSQRFWVDPGIVEDLEAAGYEVLAPDRLANARSWVEEGDRLRQFVIGDPAVVVAGSNGCSAALRLALDHPGAVESLVLCWPATPAPDETSDAIRGVADSELVTIAFAVAIIPSEPSNLHHQTRTVAALGRLIPHAVVLSGSPESPHPDFPAHRRRFIETLLSAINGR